MHHRERASTYNFQYLRVSIKLLNARSNTIQNLIQIYYFFCKIAKRSLRSRFSRSLGFSGRQNLFQCSTTSRVYFRLAELVQPRPWSISGRQSTSRDDFRSVEGVPPRPGSISSRQRVFRHVPGRFLVGRICSATSRVHFRSAEFVPPRPGSISGRQRVFRHVLVDFRSAECVPPRPASIVGH